MRIAKQKMNEKGKLNVLQVPLRIKMSETITAKEHYAKSRNNLKNSI